MRSLYLGEGLTIEQVAARFGVAATTISRRFRDLGICARPRGPLPGFRCLRPRRSATGPIEWTADLAYAVGLIATDGNLSRKRWGLSLASNDIDLLDTARRCLHSENSITAYTNGHCYHIQWRDRHFYEWLVGLGLTPAKSSTLDPLVVPVKKPLEADPTKEVTIFVAEFKPGARTGKHYHPGQEFIYVLEGEGRIEEEGKPPVDLKPGVGVYFQSDPAKPTYVHEGINLSATKPLKLVTTLNHREGPAARDPGQINQSNRGHAAGPTPHGPFHLHRRVEEAAVQRV